jgi:hypothetical protein
VEKKKRDQDAVAKQHTLEAEERKKKKQQAGAEMKMNLPPAVPKEIRPVDEKKKASKKGKKWRREEPLYRKTLYSTIKNRPFDVSFLAFPSKF